MIPITTMISTLKNTVDTAAIASTIAVEEEEDHVEAVAKEIVTEVVASAPTGDRRHLSVDRWVEGKCLN